MSTTNMNLDLPTPGADDGVWDDKINANLEIIDEHDHTSSKGVKVPTAGLDINADLSVNSNSIRDVNAVSLDTQAATLSGVNNNGTVYQVSGDLYYNNNAGTPVQITSGSSLASSGSVPALPATTKIVTFTPAGTMLAETSVDNASIEIASNNIQIRDSGVTTAKLAAGAVTQAKRAALGQQLSASSGAFSYASNTFADVTNLSVSITTTGRPIMLCIVDDGQTSLSSEIATINSSSPAYLAFVRDSTQLNFIRFDTDAAAEHRLPPSAFFTIDTPAAGTYTYKVQVRINFLGGNTIQVNYCKLLAFEL